MTNLTAATRISNESGGSIINRKDLMTIIASLRTALYDARSVENNVLDKIHPYYGKPMTVAALNRLLKRLEIKPRSVRFGGGGNNVAKGFLDCQGAATGAGVEAEEIAETKLNRIQGSALRWQS